MAQQLLEETFSEGETSDEEYDPTAEVGREEEEEEEGEGEGEAEGKEEVREEGVKEDGTERDVCSTEQTTMSGEPEKTVMDSLSVPSTSLAPPSAVPTSQTAVASGSSPQALPPDGVTTIADQSLATQGPPSASTLASSDPTPSNLTQTLGLVPPASCPATTTSVCHPDESIVREAAALLASLSDTILSPPRPVMAQPPTDIDQEQAFLHLTVVSDL